MTNSAKVKKTKWQRVLKIVMTAYIIIGIALYLSQDKFLFHPVTIKKEADYHFDQPYNEINIPINKESVLNMVQFASAGNVSKGVVLYFHGNKRNISWYAKYVPHFTKHGYEVWMIDYPGFGKSTGRLNESTLYEWALQAYKFARSRFSSDSIIIYGKSLGTGIAAQLASVSDCKRLILETPYYSMPSLVNRYFFIYPVNWMLKYKMPTWQYLQKVEVPVTIFHGTGDWLIPYSNAKRLEKFLKPGDEFISIKNGSHNDLFSFKETIGKLDSLLNQ